MKVLWYLTIILVFAASCGGEESNNQKTAFTIPKKVKPKRKPIAIPAKLKPIRLGELLPLGIVDPESKNVYQKYGVEFNGNCYACDLARLNVTSKYVTLVNVCDDLVTKKYAIVSKITEENGITIKTSAVDFEFTQVGKSKIFQLKIKRGKLLLEDLRIAGWYTRKAHIGKFEQHDCAEFDG